MSTLSEQLTPVRQAIGAARDALSGDPEMTSADGERGVAAELWRATDDELDAALGELRAVEAMAAALWLGEHQHR